MRYATLHYTKAKWSRAKVPSDYPQLQLFHVDISSTIRPDLNKLRHASADPRNIMCMSLSLKYITSELVLNNGKILNSICLNTISNGVYVTYQ